MSDATVTLAELNLYPIKGCAGIAVREALLIETGLEFDRAWMVVDADSKVFVTQRQLPRMALVRATMRSDDLMLKAPGMLALHLSLDAVEEPCRVRVWKDDVAAYDMGNLAAQWFSDFLGRKLRLVRFDPEQKRLSNMRWTGGIEAENAFSDGYPLLAISRASLDALNQRLLEKGGLAVEMRRFRPNLVLDGLDAHGEDLLDEIAFDTPDGPVRLKMAKPCVRCEVPNVDLATAEVGTEPLATLSSYRADARVDGGITFGMNAVVAEGVDCVLRQGMSGAATIRF